MENDQQEISIDCLVLLATHFGITMDDLLSISTDNSIPKEITIEAKSSLEQLKLVKELEPDEKNIAFKLIDTFLTQKKFKDYFQKNIPAL